MWQVPQKADRRLFLEELRRQVYEQYRPAFTEVTSLLQEGNFRRAELEDVGVANESNRFQLGSSDLCSGG
ncbi:hypothetical protein SS37A_41260 (plasmid) [Methylocystis iwaonis]|uniref:DUF1127 domain-containing protein n=1 Tax=Methylocystis iwaonis TaxID=2885079 RepID=A0ABM8EEW2_9HYPH|nr:hypothetical protein SS37A_41260 [Methylocystis iwaonis]